jgi:hypothetical protein
MACFTTAFDQRFAGIGPQQSGDDGNGRRLPRAVGAKQADGLTRAGAQRDTVDGSQVAIALLQSLDFEHYHPIA